MVFQIWIFLVSYYFIPAISETLKLSEANMLNFSIVIEDEHINMQVLPKRKFDGNNDIISHKGTKNLNNLKETFIHQNNTTDTLYVGESDESLLVKRKKCCGVFECFEKLFKKKN